MYSEPLYSEPFGTINISRPERRPFGNRWRWILSLALALALTFVLVESFHLYADEGDVELQGAILLRPPGAGGMGEWLVRGTLTDGNPPQTYTVVADAKTQFDHGLPRIGDRVRIKGTQNAPLLIFAREFDRENSAGNPGKYETKGQVAQRPASPDGTGTWQLVVDASSPLTVTADANTRFPRGIPDIGQWVEVKGALQGDGTLLAERMRVDEFVADQLIVRLKSGVNPAELSARHPLTLVQSILASANIHLFASATGEELEGDWVQDINSQDRDIVAWAEVNFARGIPEGNPYDIWEWGGQEISGYTNQFAFEQIHLDSATITETGAGLIVAVIDSGVSLSHPALISHLVAGRDFVDGDLIADEEPGGTGWGHGTHVAGIIARIAPDAQLLPVRVLDPQGRGNSFAVASALEWAVQQGADVINLSLGSDSDSRLLHDAVEWTIDQGVVVVAAAGNSQSSLPHFPAAYAPVVSVTGVDAAGVKASFANYGRDWVDVAAPAVGITSTIVGPEGNGYAGWSGTSMATAFVSGAMALERQRYPRASVAELAQMVHDRAANLDGVNPGYTGQLGGLLDVRALLNVPTFHIFAPQLQR